MATSASFSNTFSVHTHRCFSLPSSTHTKHISLQHARISPYTIPGMPISTASFSSCPVLNACKKIGNSRVIDDGYKYGRRSFLKSSVSAQQENQLYQTNNVEGSGADEFQVPESAEDKMLPSSLKSLMQAYKKSVLDGDEEAMYEVEDIIVRIEKEKNDLAHKVSTLSVEISSAKEKYVRLQADFDNYRKRSEKDRLTVRSDAQGEVLESLLPLVDSFERAKQQIKLETDNEKKIDASYQGIYKQFVEIMRSLRVAAVPTVGKPFDPLMHEAIAREESSEFKEGIIIQEFRRGFYLGDRLLRPAMVKVSSGPGKKKPPPVPEQSPEQPASVAGVDNR